MCPDRPVALIPDDAIDPALVRYAAVWKPKPGALRQFPNLEVIFNLGAGVDAVVADATLPDVPLVRVAVDDLTRRMTEYVVMHVLMHHRRQGYYAESQRNSVWAPKLQWAARDLRVGVMGLGVLGRDAARGAGAHRLRCRGLEQHAEVDPRHRVLCRRGATRRLSRPHRCAGVPAAADAADARHPQSHARSSRLARDGKLGGPVIINAGRGGLQVEDDILGGLDDGTLAAATLDVFGTEPLPADSPFWAHPKVTLSPHNAADTDPDAISVYVAEQIAAFERGETLMNVVDRSVGY